ncbi:unnamed protein product [Pedinophyceae sp. YPF-701]|nr:unnamed protein product [Pedinophyceae sp. YPF-701]
MQLRKRRRPSPPDAPDALSRLLSIAATLRGSSAGQQPAHPKLLVVSGAGLSAEAGMSTFTSPGGLYARALRALGLPATGDRSRAFHYSTFRNKPDEAQAFYAEIREEALRAEPTRAHKAIAQLDAAGLLQRHVTLNVDGLALAAGQERVQPDAAAPSSGGVVELHGSVLHAVCRSCGARERMSDATARAFKRARVRGAGEARPAELMCGACADGRLRFAMMLYSDGEGHLITPNAALALLRSDACAAAAVLWVGLSFVQSASVSYFTAAYRASRSSGRAVPHFVVNTDAEAMFDLASACADELHDDVALVQEDAATVLGAVARAAGLEDAAQGDEEP